MIRYTNCKRCGCIVPTCQEYCRKCEELIKIYEEEDENGREG